MKLKSICQNLIPKFSFFPTITLTVQSTNNKTISAYNAGDNSLLSVFNQSQPTSLPYDNLLIKVQTASTFTMENVGTAVRHIPNDFIYLAVAFGLLFLTVAILNVGKK